jgi:hypothetical protein
MKQIQPVSVWYNGQMLQATILNCTGQDNFSNNVSVYYQLFDSNNTQLAQGNLNLTGADYTAYNTSPNGIDYVYDWSANKLNLTIIS